jgi:hypothetical protein
VTDRGAVIWYLEKLIDWLNEDRWPIFASPQGPRLARADIERKLTIRTRDAGGAAADRDIGADALAGSFQRLVILGGSGSGKTWLAKRIARECAKRAWDALEAGADVDAVELPLYTTCSMLVQEKGHIREAAASAVNQVPGLGAGSIAASLRRFFGDRQAPILLVLDALDEATNPDSRVGEADKQPWRLVLTSRPNSWKKQVEINPDDPGYQVGDLQPLTYPEDVNAFIAKWFQIEGTPEKANSLTKEIEKRPDLRQSATVPLLLAFYCIAAGSEDNIPQIRSKLYDQVVRQLLVASWHGGTKIPKIEKCLDVLRKWAWSTVEHHPVSDVGLWTNEFPTSPDEYAPEVLEAVGHIAVSVSQSLGTIENEPVITRRFIHRSIQEYLVAQYVALQMTAEQASKELLSHIWYDPGWRQAAPAGLAMHRDRNQVLRELILRLYGSLPSPEELPLMDSCWEFRDFLSQVASMSSETDWDQDLAAVIGNARVQLALSEKFYITSAIFWPTSNREARSQLLGILRHQQDADATYLASNIISLSQTEEEMREACGELLEIMTATPDAWIAGELGWAIAKINPTAEQQSQARDIILTYMKDDSTTRYMASYAADLTTSPEDKWKTKEALTSMLFTENEAEWACHLADGISMLAPSLPERRAAIEYLLSFPISLTPYLILLCCHGLDAQEALSLLLELSELRARSLISTDVLDKVRELARTAPDRMRALRILLDIPWANFNVYNARDVTGTILALGPTVDDRIQLTQKIFGFLGPGTVLSLLPEIIRLAETEEQRAYARREVLKYLPQVDIIAALALIKQIMQLKPTVDELEQAFDATWEVGGIKFSFKRKDFSAAEGSDFSDCRPVSPVADDFSSRMRKVLLEELAGCTDAAGAADIAGKASWHHLSEEEKRQFRSILLNHLEATPVRESAKRLVHELTQLDPTSDDLATWCTWVAPPTTELLAAARRSSKFPDWFKLLSIPAVILHLLNTSTWVPEGERHHNGRSA